MAPLVASMVTPLTPSMSTSAAAFTSIVPLVPLPAVISTSPFAVVKAMSAATPEVLMVAPEAASISRSAAAFISMVPLVPLPAVRSISPL